MQQPTNLIPLVDGDILRYEIGFASEVAWKHVTDEVDSVPPFDFVEKVLLNRLDWIRESIGTDQPMRIFLTEGVTFRYALAVTKDYKSSRKGDKPWHFDNLTAYMVGVLGAEIVTHLEADDMMALEQVKGGNTTIICSRDKDLKQVPGWCYSWEIGNQPAFGPFWVEGEGAIELDRSKKKPVLRGHGLAFFYSQMLTGDIADTIPGLQPCGPVKAYEILNDAPDMEEAVRDAYSDDVYMLEQGRLLWMTRRLHPDGSPVLWEIGMVS